MVTQIKKEKRARWKKELRFKRESIFRWVFLQLQTGRCYHDPFNSTTRETKMRI